MQNNNMTESMAAMVQMAADKKAKQDAEAAAAADAVSVEVTAEPESGPDFGTAAAGDDTDTN